MVEEFNRILIPTDGSEYTLAAVKKGLSLAKLVNAEVTAIFVVDESAFSGIPADSMITDVYSILDNEGQTAIDTVVKMGERMGVVVSGRVVHGAPARTIVDEAKDHDIIVMGTLGRSGLEHLLLGSVAEQVVRHAPCPVMLIRMPKTE